MPEHGSPHVYLGRTLDQPLTRPPQLLARLDHWAAVQPDRPWLTGVTAAGESATLTFGLAAEYSNRLARWLANQTGAVAENTVALFPTNDIRSALTVLALLRLRCVVFFVGPHEPAERQAEMLASRPVAAVLAADPEVADAVPGALAVPDPATLPEASPGNTAARRDPLAVALLFATSGSTATAKTVAQSEYGATVNAEALLRHHGLAPGVRVLGCLPVSHVNGLHLTLLATLWSGAEAVLLPAFDGRLYRRALETYQPTLASVVPSILEQLANGENPVFGPRFRYFVSAAAPLSTRTSRRVVDRLGVRVVQGYGLTETTNFATTMPTELSDEDYRALVIDADVPSVGVPLFGNEVAVLRPDGSPADLGETGEVCMRGHNLMLGYDGNADATAEAFANGWFHSGDLGHCVAGPGGQSFLVLTGRSKNMAKVLGVAVSLEEMERRLRQLPAVADAACFAVPDRFRGEAVVAVVAGVDRPGRSALHAHLADYFAPASLPSRYVYAAEIPRSTTGKILRGQLTEMFAGPHNEPESAR